MNTWLMIVREIRCRLAGFGAAVLAVAIAIGSLVSTQTALKRHDLETETVLGKRRVQTQQRMADLREAMRQATLKLRFNLLILPRAQDLKQWHTEGFADTYMPESHVDTLADSGVVTVRHFLPILQQKLKWPEQKRTIMLVGTRGEVPNLHKTRVSVLVDPVPAGSVVLGNELHRSLGIAAGDEIAMFGKTFKVHKCYEERGTRDDITAWIHLKQAQEIVEQPDKINAILALECMCADDLSTIRQEISRVLPDTQAIEMGSKVLARYEARMRVAREGYAAVEKLEADREAIRGELEQLAARILPILIAAAAGWVCWLAFANVRERTAEVGIVRSLGFRTTQVLGLFAARSLLIGVLGGAIGIVLGLLAGHVIPLQPVEDVGEFTGHAVGLTAAEYATALFVAILLAALAGWIPSLLAARKDPADILRQR